MTMKVFIAVDTYPAKITYRDRGDSGEFVHSVAHERIEPGHHAEVWGTSTRSIIIEELPQDKPV